MAQSTSRASDRLLMRLAVGVILVFVAWTVLGWLLSALIGTLVALIRVALLLGLLAIVGWFVLVGPAGADDE
jgi:hypothetical protein